MIPPRTIGCVLVLGVSAPALVVAGAAEALASGRPPAGVTASPARVVLRGAERALIHVANRGRAALVVEAAPTGFGLDLRGRPRIVASRSRSRSLVVSPHRLLVVRGGTSVFSVHAALSRRSPPGERDALVLLTTRALTAAGVPVRMRLGVRVVIRVPGPLVRRLVLGSLRVSRRRGRTLELLVGNRGNVSELVGPRRIVVTLLRRGRVVATLRPARRELLPHSLALLDLHSGRRVRGRVTARVVLLRPSPRRARLDRTFGLDV